VRHLSRVQIHAHIRIHNLPDVASQSTSPGWNLGKWADYVALPPSKREKILNVISLEISGTELANMILPPKIVRTLDWVENFWPSTKKNKQNAYPKVQLYCLMGVANAWTVSTTINDRSLPRSSFTMTLVHSRIGISISQDRLCIITYTTGQR
jgi:hypothetical protein